MSRGRVAVATVALSSSPSLWNTDWLDRQRHNGKNDHWAVSQKTVTS